MPALREAHPRTTLIGFLDTLAVVLLVVKLFMCDLYQLYANEEFLIGALLRLLVRRSQMLLMRALPHTSAIVVLIVLQVAHS